MFTLMFYILLFAAFACFKSFRKFVIVVAVLTTALILIPQLAGLDISYNP
jgi:hypothetical protein